DVVAAACNALVPECTGADTTLPVEPLHVHGASVPVSKPPLTGPPPPGGLPLGVGVGDRLGVGVGVRLGFGVGVPVGGTVPDVNGSKMWLNCHVPCEIPEQLSLPPVPGQLPLSRCSAQNDSSAICWPTAQLSTAFASATVNVSAAPKSSMPTISVTPTMCQAVLDDTPKTFTIWPCSPVAAVFVSFAIWWLPALSK